MFEIDPNATFDVFTDQPTSPFANEEEKAKAMEMGIIKDNGKVNALDLLKFLGEL